MFIERLPLTSMDVKAEQLSKLKSLFPEVFNEEKVDWEKLQRTLGESIDSGTERFGMNWPGKSDCFKIIQQPSVVCLDTGFTNNDQLKTNAAQIMKSHGIKSFQTV